MSKGIDGIFDESNKELVWKSHNGEMSVFQVQGIDIRVQLENENGLKQYSPYSNPAHELFISLLKYTKDNDNLPSLEDISNINGISPVERNYCEGIASGMMLEYDFNNTLPFYEDNIIKIPEGYLPMLGGYPQTELSYTGFVKEGEFVISSFSKEGIDIVNLAGEPIANVQEKIPINQDDALKIMKGIYFFSPKNVLLREVYSVTQK